MASKEKEIEAPSKKDNVAKGSAINMGEYSCHVFIEETRNLLNPAGKKEPTSPIVSVSVFDQTKMFHIKRDVTNNEKTYWGEHFFFQKKINVRR